jgi:hypothetical protein
MSKIIQVLSGKKKKRASSACMRRTTTSPNTAVWESDELPSISVEGLTRIDNQAYSARSFEDEYCWLNC